MFDGMPTRPVLIIVPILMSMVLGLYYWDSYDTCTEKSEFRSRFIKMAQQASEQSDQLFSVNAATDFSWDTVTFFPAFKFDEKPVPDCPFGWDWSEVQRKQLAKDGHLSLLIFAKADKMINYLDIDTKTVDIGKLKKVYSNDKAQFNVSSDATLSRLLLSEYSSE